MGKALEALQTATTQREQYMQREQANDIKREHEKLASQISAIMGDIDLDDLALEFEALLAQHARDIANKKVSIIMVYGSGTTATNDPLTSQAEIHRVFSDIEEGSMQAISTLKTLQENNYNLLKIGKEKSAMLANFYQGAAGWGFTNVEKPAIVLPWDKNLRGSFRFLTTDAVAVMGHGIGVLYKTNVPVGSFKYADKLAQLQKLLDESKPLIQGSLNFSKSRSFWVNSNWGDLETPSPVAAHETLEHN